MWFNILKKTKTDEILEKWFKMMDEDTDKATADRIQDWFHNLSLSELYEAREVTEVKFSNNEDYRLYLDRLMGLIDIITDAELEEKDRAWVKANPEKAKERDKKNEESRLRSQKLKEEINAREEARNRKIWESHARAKTAKRKPTKRKGQRRRY